jgi:hypothetical protein
MLVKGLTTSKLTKVSEDGIFIDFGNCTKWPESLKKGSDFPAKRSQYLTETTIENGTWESSL